ncbi:protein of unknown function, partial [Pseudomonas inefficax]
MLRRGHRRHRKALPVPALSQHKAAPTGPVQASEPIQIPDKEKPGRGRVFHEASNQLLGLGFYLSFNATVDSAAFFGGVVGNRTGFAVANRVNTAGFHAVLLGQDLLDSVGTTLGQLLVVSVWADG